MQRVWASESRRAVQIGGLIGCVATVVVVFLSGCGGRLPAMAISVMTVSVVAH